MDQTLNDELLEYTAQIPKFVAYLSSSFEFLTILKPLHNYLSLKSCASSLFVTIPFISVSILHVFNSFKSGDKLE